MHPVSKSDVPEPKPTFPGILSCNGTGKVPATPILHSSVGGWVKLICGFISIKTNI